MAKKLTPKEKKQRDRQRKAMKLWAKKVQASLRERAKWMTK